MFSIIPNRHILLKRSKLVTAKNQRKADYRKGKERPKTYNKNISKEGIAYGRNEKNLIKQLDSHYNNARFCRLSVVDKA
jgi:hypothetical protein